MILDELIKLMEAEAEDICFNPGASELSVESLESVIEQDLPDDYWTFLHEHDGQRRDTKPLLGVYRLMSINEMEIEYIRRVDEARKGHTFSYAGVSDVRVQAGLDWRPGWLFFAREDADGNFFVMDFSPTEKGTSGQIFQHCYESPDFRVLANSFSHLVQITCDQIKAGNHTRYGRRARYETLEFDS